MDSPHRIRVLFAGARTSEADRLEASLLPVPDIVIVGECVEPAAIGDFEREFRPDVILLHFSDALSAKDGLRDTLSRTRQTKLLVVLPDCTEEQTTDLLEHGARGVLIAADQCALVARAIRAVYEGEIWASRSVLSVIAQMGIRHVMETQWRSRSMVALTEREREIVELLRAGSSNKEIAARLNISDKTVKTHMQHIFDKLQVRRRQMVITAP